jgi:uncharacterized protein (DUF2252 family)
MTADTDAAPGAENTPDVSKRATRATPRKVTHLTREERAAKGKAARQVASLASHAEFEKSPGRPDPVAQLQGQAAARVEELVPIRYGRMSTSAFAFYRGAALVMASDLSRTPSPGLFTQLCGDAHLSNFGVFGSPERHLLFDLNDFDETAPGPFEWDVKRLAASLEIAGRGNGFKTKERRAVVVAAVRSYRESMRAFADQGNLAVWYARLDVEQVMKDLRSRLPLEGVRRADAALAKAKTRDSTNALEKMTTTVKGRARIVGDPPLIETIDTLFPDRAPEDVMAEMRELIRSYRTSLVPDRRHLLEQYRLVDMARKVVGVGSVGTRCWILLLEGVDGGDPLFLQAKEASASVLTEFVGFKHRGQHGERVVSGQRLMQAASDIFLGWQRATGIDGVQRDFYLRQLRDWKASLPPEQMVPAGMTAYGQLCGWTLARAHARAGDRIALAAYLGRKDTFEEAIADFAVAYADQNEKDHARLLAAIADGRVEARTGL